MTGVNRHIACGWRKSPWGRALFLGVALLGGLPSGCGKSSQAANLKLEQALPSSAVIEEAGQAVQSADGMAVLTLPAGGPAPNVRDTNSVIRALSHLPEALGGDIGQAYGVFFQKEGENAVITIRYDEKSLPLGADESDLTLGRRVGNQWQEVRDAVLDVVSNTVRGRIVFTGATDVYGVFVRPHPQFSNASFNEAVSSEKSSGGWIWDTRLPDFGGVRNIRGNNVFLIQDNGQMHADSRIRQIISGFTPGRNYTLTGLFAGYGDCCEGGQSAASFGVAVDGRIILKRSRPLEEGLIPFSATLQATKSAHEISFITRTQGGGRAAYVIDDIALTPIRGVRLDVAKTGPEEGVVRSLPAGIDCGMACSASFASGHAVTLFATAAPGFFFSGFSREACAEGSVCTLTMDSAKTVTAIFEKASTNAMLAKLETRADQSYAGGKIAPEFNPNVEAYQVARVEQPRFVTFIAESEQAGAMIRIGGRVTPSGQPVQFYFDEQERAVPIVVTAQDGQTTKRYTVRVCRWYCGNQPRDGAVTHPFLKNG